ncbi:MAG TPA: DUF748 domain-containing protein [Steroidobacteraceae bacterium]|nr:DUF748 domain-containing protein [Steroidobacteraceae bacterium]
MTGVRGRRFLGLLAIIAGLVALYAAVGFLLVPRWIRSELVGLTARDFGRTLSIGDVRFNPFTWTLEITEFSLPDADGRPMISFGRLEVAVGIASVTRLAPSLSEIVLESPRVSAVVRRDGKLNLSDLEKPFAQPANATAPPSGSKPLRLFVDRLAVTSGSATYEDDTRSVPFRLDLNPIGFELLGFSTSGNTAGRYHLTATIGQGGRLDWTGTIRTAPISLHGALELDGLTARTVGAYLGPVLPAKISRGTLALEGAFAIDRSAQGVRMTIDVPQARVSGLGVRPRQAASDYVQLNRFTLDHAHIDLEQRSIRVGAITLAGADVRGWLDQDGKLNLLELLGRSAGQPTGSAAASPGPAPSPPSPASPQPSSRTPGWRIAAPDIRIEDTRVSLQDRGVKPAADLTLGAITARITGYDSSPRNRITVSLRAAVNGSGRLQLTAAGTLQPEALSAKLRLSRVDLRALQPYLNEYTALTLVSGFLSTQLDIGRRADGQLDAAGRIDVAGLRAVDDDLKQDFVKWHGLHIAGLRYVSSPASLRIQRITAVSPYARVIIGADHTINVSEALHPRGAHPKAEAVKTAQEKTAQEKTASPNAAAPSGENSASASPSMAMQIGVVRIAGGTADYADFSMQPDFATGIQDLHGTIKGLSSDPSSRADVSLKGKVDRYAPVDISGVVNLLSATTYTDIRMKFRRLELTRMTPYSVRFAGYEIASGTLDADLHYKVDHGTLNADHTLVIDQLQLGDQVPSPHATKLPLRLAVALLKDRDGVIRLGLPVTGSLNNPQFSLGPLIGKALLHVLEKAVAAPFAMLGRAFGGGPDMNRIDFAPGSATLLPASQTRLTALAKALAQRPQLQLQVPATFAADVDRAALAKRKLRAELIALARSGAGAPEGRGRRTRGRQQAPRPRPTAGKEVLELPASHYRLLRAAYQNAFGPKAPLPASAQKVPPFDPAILEMQAALLKRMQVSEADLQALGQRRAEAIRSAIVAAGGVAAGRIAITAAGPQPATAGQVAVKLGLK